MQTRFPPAPIPPQVDANQRLQELPRYMEAATLSSTMIAYCRNEMRQNAATPDPAMISTKRKAPYPGQDSYPLNPKRARVVSSKRIRTPVHKAKHRASDTRQHSKRHEEAKRTLGLINARNAEEVVALAQARYFTSQLALTFLRLRELDGDFTGLLQQEEEFPPELPNMRTLYTDFYNNMMDLTTNIICASCGCLHHHADKFKNLSVTDPLLRHLEVDPSLVPFSFASLISQLDDLHVMVDTASIVVPQPDTAL